MNKIKEKIKYIFLNKNIIISGNKGKGYNEEIFKLIENNYNNYLPNIKNINIRLVLDNKKNLTIMKNINNFNNSFNKFKCKKKIEKINLIKENKLHAKKIIFRNESNDVDKIKKDIIKYNNYKKISDLRYYILEKKIPKVSIIITIYNQERFIPKIYACIQDQFFEDLEIIFIDDDSEDKSSKIIKKLMEMDKRIIYIKNLINKGQFYTRNKAALFSKGEYILIIDPDDFLLNNIIIKSYMTAKYYNLDIVHYHHMVGNVTNNTLFKKKNISGIFYQPEIKNIFFLYKDRYLWDKLIKREIFIKSIYFMKDKFRKERFSIHNDDTACFGLFRVAKSYGFLEQIGYFYNRGNENSTHKQNYLEKNINGRYRSLFSTMKYYYEQTDNNTYEKTMGGYNFYKLRVTYRYKNKINFLTKGFDYIIDIIDLYINSPYYNNKQKKSLKKFKKKIIRRKNEINNSKIKYRKYNK